MSGESRSRLVPTLALGAIEKQKTRPWPGFELMRARFLRALRPSGTAMQPAFVAGTYVYFGRTATHFMIVDGWAGNLVRSVDTHAPTVLAGF